MRIRSLGIDSRVFCAIPAAFLAVCAMTAAFARADSSAAVDQILLLNAVRGAEVAQDAVAMKSSDPCASAANAGLPTAPAEDTAIIFPAQESDPELAVLAGSEKAKGTYAYQASY